MKLIATPDNELEVWEGSRKVGYCDESGAVFAYVGIGAAYAGDASQRGEIVPVLKAFLKEEA